MSDKPEMVIMAPPEWGPWVGAPEHKRRLCAVEDCSNDGRPQICFLDGRYHHHGCIHYESARGPQPKFRKGWGWLCDQHYASIQTTHEATPRPQ